MQKPLFQHGHRYTAQIYLEATDLETRYLGYTYLVSFSYGDDLLDHCLYRMETPSSFGGNVTYTSVGNIPYSIQLHKDFKIQELIDVMEVVIENESLSLQEKLYYLDRLASPFQYYMSYYSRIGSQCCNSLPLRYENHRQHRYPKLRIDDGWSFGRDNVYHLWKDGKECPISVSDYWKQHTLSEFGATKEDYIEFLNSLPEYRKKFFISLNIQE